MDASGHDGQVKCIRVAQQEQKEQAWRRLAVKGPCGAANDNAEPCAVDNL